MYSHTFYPAGEFKYLSTYANFVNQKFFIYAHNGEDVTNGMLIYTRNLYRRVACTIYLECLIDV